MTEDLETATGPPVTSSRGYGVRILRGLLALLMLTGLAAVGRALSLVLERREVVAKTFACDPRTIAGLLGLGGLSLVAALWLSLRAWRRAEPAGLVTPLRLLFEVSVLAAAAYHLALQPFKRASFEVTVGLALGLWGVLMVIRFLGPGLGRFRAIHGLDLMVFNLCLFAVLAEGGLRLAAHFFPSPLFAQVDQRSTEVIRKRLKNHPPGKLRFGFPLNSRSHYDAELGSGAAGKRRVVVIGDSFSFGVVPHHYHFTTVAERHSRLDVYNIGFPGIGPREYLWLLRYQALPLAPEAVVVSLFVGNDVSGFRPLESRNRTLKIWLDRNNLLVAQVPPRLLRLWRQRAASRPNQPVGGLEGQAIERRITTTREMVATYPWLADPAREAPTFILPGVFLDIETRRAQRACDPQADYSGLFEILREMRRVAGDVRFAVMIIPDEFQVDDELWAQIVERSEIDGLSRDLPQRLIGEWLAKEKIPYLDLLPELRSKCAPHHRGDSHCYHLRDTHFNARGNRLTGEALAEFLTRDGSPPG